MTTAARNPSPSQPRDQPAGSDQALSFIRVGPDQRQPALSLLLTGHTADTGGAVDPFLAFTVEHGLSLDELWVAERNGEPMAAILVVPGAGRTAMAFISPMHDAPIAHAASQLTAAVTQAQDPDRIRLMQVLLEPHQHREARAVQQAGYSELAELLYMERASETGPVPLQLEQTITVANWSQRHRSCFADAIVESYRDTLDCPALVGLRHIDDIIAGHMATGQFNADLWIALHAHGKPVAVMLLNQVPRRSAIELVYLGVCPDWRDRRIAHKLLAHGLGLAHQQGADHVILAVDKNNKPALNLYRAHRFTTTARRIAMIHPLGE